MYSYSFSQDNAPPEKRIDLVRQTPFRWFECDPGRWSHPDDLRIQPPCPVWYYLIEKESWELRKRESFFVNMAVNLLPILRIKQPVIFIKGDSNCGKSNVVIWIPELFGEQNVARISDGDQPLQTLTRTTRVIVHDEFTASRLKPDTCKKLWGREFISVKHIFRSVVITYCHHTACL